MATIRRSLVLLLICTVVFGFLYTLAGVGLSQVLFPHQANGSIAADGSTLIGQDWARAACPGHPAGSCVFHGRPDDTGPYAADPKAGVAGGDNPLEANGIPGASGGTNLGPRSKTLLDNTRALMRYWDNLGVDPTPDLVTTSGSGYDPDITPQDATVQIPMVAKATGIRPASLRALIRRQTHGEQLGFLGSRYLNVLQLNKALVGLEHGRGGRQSTPQGRPR